MAAGREKRVLFAASLSLPEEHRSLGPESVLIVDCSVPVQLRGSQVTVIRTCFADSTFQDVVSYPAFKPSEVEILCKTLGVEDGKEPVGAFTALDTPAFKDWPRSSNLNGDEHSCPILTTQKAVRRFSVSQRTCVAVRTCISFQHSRCLNYKALSSSRSSHRGRGEGGEGQSQRIQRVCDHLDLIDTACEASSAARRRVSRVAVRACRRQWLSESYSCSIVL